jgi:hypothetical protein
MNGVGSAVEEVLGRLNAAVVQSGERLEGNCYFRHESFEPVPELASKRTNLLEVGRRASRILEIGFNAGHSAVLLLSARRDSVLWVCDIATHGYVEACVAILQDAFPGRIRFVRGDSASCIPSFLASQPGLMLDAVHVDGSHTPYAVCLDVHHVLPALVEGGLLVLDDISVPHIQALGVSLVREGVVEIAEGFQPTAYYPHAVFAKRRYDTKWEQREFAPAVFQWHHDLVSANGEVQVLAQGRLSTTWGEGEWGFLGGRCYWLQFGGQNHIVTVDLGQEGFLSAREADGQLSLGLVRDFDTIHFPRRGNASIAMVTLALGAAYRDAVSAGLASKILYCREQGYGLIYGGQRCHDRSRPLPWSKIPLVADALLAYEYVFFSDADVVWLNYATRLETLCEELRASGRTLLIGRDVNALNSGNFLIRRTPHAASLLSQVYQNVRWVDDPWWENRSIIDLYENDAAFASQVLVLPLERQAEINGYEGHYWEAGGNAVPLNVHFAGVYDTALLHGKMLEYFQRAGVARSAAWP